MKLFFVVLFCFSVMYAQKLPAVISASPQGVLENMNQAAQISIRFSEPAVMLQPSGNIEKPDFIELMPVFDAAYYWQNTDTLVIVPSNLSIAKKYTVVVNTDEKYEFSFYTPLLKIHSSTPYSGAQQCGRRQQILLWMNMEVSCDVIKDYIALSARTHDGQTEEIVKNYTVKYRYNRYNKSFNRKCIELNPDKPFPADSKITVTLKKGARAFSGHTGTLEDYCFSFDTEPEFSVVPFEKNILNPENSVYIHFTSPVSYAEAGRYVRVFEETGESLIVLSAEKSCVAGSSYYYYLDSYNLKPGHSYRIYVSESIKNIYGERLNKGFQQNFTFGHFPVKLYPAAYETVIPDKSGILNIWAMNVLKAEISVFPLDENSLHSLIFREQIPENKETYTMNLNTETDVMSLQQLEIPILKKPGIYYFTVLPLKTTEKCAEEHYYYSDSGIVQVSETLILFKHSPKEFLARLTDVHTGISESCNFRIYDESGEIFSGISDSRGIAQGKYPETSYDTKLFYVLGKAGDSYITTRWSEGIEPWDYGIYNYGSWLPQFPYEQGLYTAAAYTDRDLYLPEDTVYYAGVIRRKENSGLSQIHKPVKIKVLSPSGILIHTAEVQLGSFGEFIGQFSAPSEMTGKYRIQGILDNKGIFELSVKVSEYKRPEFQLVSHLEKNEMFVQDTNAVSLKSSYYSGNPISASSILGITLRPGSFRPPGADDFVFRDEIAFQKHTFRSLKIESVRINTDENGYAQHEFTIEKLPGVFPCVLETEYTVTDSMNEQISARSSCIVHPALFYTGIQEIPYFIRAGSRRNIQFKALFPDGSENKNAEITVRLMRRIYRSARQSSAGQRLEYVSYYDDTEEMKFSVFSGGNHEVIFKEPGYCYIVAESKDLKGRISRSSCDMYVSGGYVFWERGNTDIIDMIFSKEVYRPGETVSAILKSPYKNATAFVTVERSGIVDYFSCRMKDGGVIEFPVKENYFPVSYISVMLQPEPEEKVFGYKTACEKLTVSDNRNRLDVSLQLPGAVLPGQRVTVEGKVRGRLMKPEKAVVFCWAVDKAVCNLTGFNPDDPVRKLYPEENLEVSTAWSMLNMIGYRHFGKKGDPSGGGGGYDTLMQAVRKNFKGTAFFKRCLTDEYGNFVFDAVMPDTLTEYRVFAAAFNADEMAGIETGEFNVQKPVALASGMPMFLRFGDTGTGFFTISNITDDTAEIVFSCDGEGISVESEKKEFYIPPRQNRTCRVKFSAVKTNIAVMTASAKNLSASYTDIIRIEIPVRTSEYRAAVMTSGIFNEHTEETVKLSDTVKDPEISLCIGPNGIAAMKQYFQLVWEYPYGCLEQQASKIYPLTFSESAVSFFLPKTDRKKREDIFRKFSVYAQKCLNEDNGFGYWPESEDSSIYLTAYVCRLLKNISSSENKKLIEKAHVYFEHILKNHRKSDAFSVYDILYSIDGLDGKYADSYAEYLFSNRHKLGFAAKTVLVHYLKGNMKERVIQEIKQSFQYTPDSITLPETRHWWMYHESTAKNYAAALLFAVKNCDSKTVRFILNGLSRHMSSRNPATHDAGFILNALNALYEKNKKTFSPCVVSVAVGNVNAASLQFHTSESLPQFRNFTSSALSALFKENPVQKIEFSSEPESEIFYSARYSYVLKTLNEPVNKGFLMNVTYSDVLNAGENAVMTVKIQTPAERSFVAAEIPIPAGIRMTDTSFKTSASTGMLKKSHCFVRAEQRFDKLCLFADYMPSGEYVYEVVVNAVNPGNYLLPPGFVSEMYHQENYGMIPSAVIKVSE